jgi:hypothetical protein
MPGLGVGEPKVGKHLVRVTRVPQIHVVAAATLLGREEVGFRSHYFAHKRHQLTRHSIFTGYAISLEALGE